MPVILFDLAVFRDCLGVVDCQWCQVQKDGQTPLKSPYCDSQRVCFGGVVGAHSPYGDEISGECGLGAPILCLVCLLCVCLSCECVCCVSVCCVFCE